MSYVTTLSFAEIMQHRRWDSTNDTDGEEGHCYSVHHKSHTFWPDIELGPPHWDARGQC